MDNNTHALKRRWEEDNAQYRTNTNVERGDIWLDDGNIVLIADGTFFKVHRSVLSRHSEIFRDMLMIPQPVDTENIDGCPIVHLSDSKKDLMHILSALYDGGNEYFLSQKQLKFSAVLAMLRLGTKYQIEHIRHEAVRRLQQCFPNKLEDFRVLSFVTLNRNIIHFFPCDFVSLSSVHAIAVISLARTFNLPQLLPTAFYVCAQLAPEEIIDGFVDEDETPWTLSSDDIKKCLRGQARLRAWSITGRCWLLDPEASTSICLNQSGICKRVLRKAAPSSWSLFHIECNTLIDSAWIDESLRVVGEAEFRVCNKCCQKFKEEYEGVRSKVWTNLHQIFGWTIYLGPTRNPPWTYEYSTAKFECHDTSRASGCHCSHCAF